MTIAFQWERFSSVAHELPRLFVKHYEEVVRDKENFVMDFKWERHLDMDRAGVLRPFTARSNGLLIGYVLWFVNENLNFTIINAITSLYYLDPLYRSTGEDGGRMLFRESEAGLAKMGVQLALITSPSGGSVEEIKIFDRMMKAMGYNPFQNVYSKMIQAKENS